MSVWWSLTTWAPVSDALESIVGCSASLPNLSDGNDTVVSVDHPLQGEVNTCIDTGSISTILISRP